MALIIEKLIFSCVIKSLTPQLLAICNTMKSPPNMKSYLNKIYLEPMFV